jgi:hypothetical protein
MNRWENYFSQLLNVYRVGDVRQIKVHTDEALVPHPSPFEVQITNAKLKIYKSPGSYQISAELVQTGVETLRTESHKITKAIWSKEELPDQWKESITVPI